MFNENATRSKTILMGRKTLRKDFRTNRLTDRAKSGFNSAVMKCPWLRTSSLAIHFQKEKIRREKIFHTSRSHTFIHSIIHLLSAPSARQMIRLSKGLSTCTLYFEPLHALSLFSIPFSPAVASTVLHFPLSTLTSVNEHESLSPFLVNLEF